MPLVVLNGPIIAAGESLSSAIECNGDLVRVTMPADWTSANITFQISTDGLGYNDLMKRHGGEAMVAVTPGTAVLIPEGLARGIGFLKIRSGTRDHPIEQEAQREFAIAVQQGA